MVDIKAEHIEHDRLYTDAKYRFQYVAKFAGEMSPI